MPAKKSAKKPTKKPAQKRWVVLGQHDANSPAEYVKTADTYEEALVLAGKYWTNSDLNFDPKRKGPFWVDPAGGYDERVEIVREKGKITSVMHAEGEGPCVEIIQED